MDQPVSSFSTEGDADTVAARAVAVLVAGEMEEGDVVHVRNWLAMSSTHREAFDRARRAWAATDQIARAAAAAAARRAASSGVATARGARALDGGRVGAHGLWMSWRISLAAGVALAACIALLTLLPERGLIRTGAGEVTRTVLPDGTIAWLDGKSAVRLDFRTDLRHIELVRGRAFFAVHADPHRPFEVEAQGALARDIGTEFSVNSTTDGTDLTVREGIVNVAAQGCAITLRAGESTHWTHDSTPIPAISADADIAEAWRTGKLVFDRVALADALGAVARHRTQRLWLVDSALAQRPVSGVIFTKRIEEGLDTLAAGAQVRLVRLPFVTLVFGV